MTIDKTSWRISWGREFPWLRRSSDASCIQGPLDADPELLDIYMVVLHHFGKKIERIKSC